MCVCLCACLRVFVYVSVSECENNMNSSLDVLGANKGQNISLFLSPSQCQCVNIYHITLNMICSFFSKINFFYFATDVLSSDLCGCFIFGFNCNSFLCFVNWILSAQKNQVMVGHCISKYISIWADLCCS